MSKKKWTVVLIVVVALAAIASWAFANDETPTPYYACINNSSGTIKVWTEPMDCSNNEDPIHWNNVGPRGEQGPPGPSSAIEAFATGKGGIQLPLNHVPVDVVALDLPAGKFVSNVTFLASYRGFGPGLPEEESSFVSCRYEFIGSSGERYDLPGQSYQSGSFGGNIWGYQSHAHTHAITLVEPTKVIVVCSNGPGSSRINHMEWNVIKVDTLTIQPPE